MLTYLQGMTRPDISMSLHQCACFNNKPMLSHERAITRIVRYLAGTKTRGVIFQPDKKKGIEYSMDVDFAGGWSNAASDDAENVMSRTGYVI